jgi:hypothetical protein
MLTGFPNVGRGFLTKFSAAVENLLEAFHANTTNSGARERIRTTRAGTGTPVCPLNSCPELGKLSAYLAQVTPPSKASYHQLLAASMHLDDEFD